MKREEAKYFLSADKRLYGIVSRPDNPLSPNARFGIVLCEPFGEEKLFAQRVFANFARTLAENSFWVLRFDCMGHGDSEGNFEDSTVGTRLNDIAAAVQFLKEQSNGVHVGLFGLRLGGTIAALAAERDSGIAFVIACQPIIRGDKYFYECLRSNLTLQMAIHGKVIVTRDELIKKLENGEIVNIDGYHVSSQFYKEISTVDLAETGKAMKAPILFIQVAKVETAPVEKDLAAVVSTHDLTNTLNELVVVKEETFWKEIPMYYTRADNISAASLRWLNRLVGARA